MLFNEAEHLDVKETGEKGKSLFAKHDFKKDDTVFVAFGKIVSYPTDYTIPIDENLKIEPRDPGSLAQFICHSCEPNVGIKDRTVFVAMRDILKGEEILTSYAPISSEYPSQFGNNPLARKLNPKARHKPKSPFRLRFALKMPSLRA